MVDVGAVPLIKRRKIKVLPGIRAFTGEGVLFLDGDERPFDEVILATGYVSAVSDYLEDAEGLLNEHGHPRGLWARGSRAGLYFIGFDGYSLGGVLRSIRRDAPLVADRILLETGAAGTGGSARKQLGEIR